MTTDANDPEHCPADCPCWAMNPDGVPPTAQIAAPDDPDA